MHCIECEARVDVPRAIVGGALTCPLCDTDLVVGGRRRGSSEQRSAPREPDRVSPRSSGPWRLLRRLAVLALLAAAAAIVLTDPDGTAEAFRAIHAFLGEQLDKYY